MTQYLVKRTLVAIPVLLGITMMSYLIISLAPGDAVDLMVSPGLSKADLERQRVALGLDQPIHVRYVKWLGELVRGNLGYSFLTSRPVSERIGERVAPTVQLMFTALALSYLVAVPLGVVSATRPYSPLDYALTAFGFIGVSLPSFFLGLGAIYIFSLKLDLLPTGGMATMGGPGGVADRLAHLVLPTLVLALGNIGSVMRYTRSSMLEVVRQDYIRTARSKGLSERLVIYKHGLRNALIPVLTLIGLQVPLVLGGAIITEQIFQWPGMGRLAIEAITQRDYPVLMGLNLLTAVLVVAGNLLTDALYAWVDPRIKYS